MIKFPISVEIDITGKCNFNCLYCRNGYMKSCGDMSYEVIEKILEEIELHHAFRLSISGGEPTLHKDFEKIVAKLGSMNISWSLTTNGSNIDEMLANKLAHNNIQSVFITLSGFSSSIESRHKGVNDCFEQTINAIKACIKNHINITLGYLLTPENIVDVSQFIYFCKLNKTYAKLMKVEPLGNAIENDKFLHISDEDYNFVKNLFLKELGEMVILGDSDIAYEDRVCSAGIISCVVGFDGYVYPCVNFLGIDEFKCGSILNSSLYEIWNSSEVLKAFRKPRVYAQYCKLCVKREKCGGGCRAEAYRKFGDYNLIEAPCSICTNLNIPHK